MCIRLRAGASPTFLTWNLLQCVFDLERRGQAHLPDLECFNVYPTSSGGKPTFPYLESSSLCIWLGAGASPPS